MFDIDRDYLTQTLVDLVQIDSRNPTLTEGAPAEAAAGAYVAQALADLGLIVETKELDPNRVNVVGILKGSGNGKRLMLNGHLDTVGVADMSEPFSGAIRDGKLYGRGSQDMKGSLAAMLATAKALVDAEIELEGDLLLTFVADEEYASIGTADIARHYLADAAIVTEPTDFALCLAHRGFIWYDIEITGRAAHGSLYEEGIDANMRMGRFLAELDKLEQELLTRPAHPLAGPPSLHAAVLSGGTEISTYAAHCLLKLERRTVPGEEESAVTAEIQAILDKLSAADDTFQAKLTIDLVRHPHEVNPNAEIVQLTKAVVADRLGQPATILGWKAWTDAAMLGAVGIDAFLLGPIGAGLHSAEEWVDVDSVVELAAMLTTITMQYCGTE